MFCIKIVQLSSFILPSSCFLGSLIKHDTCFFMNITICLLILDNLGFFSWHNFLDKFCSLLNSRCGLFNFNCFCIRRLCYTLCVLFLLFSLLKSNECTLCMTCIRFVIFLRSTIPFTINTNFCILSTNLIRILTTCTAIVTTILLFTLLCFSVNRCNTLHRSR